MAHFHITTPTHFLQSRGVGGNGLLPQQDKSKRSRTPSGLYETQSKSTVHISCTNNKGRPREACYSSYGTHPIKELKGGTVNPVSKVLPPNRHFYVVTPIPSDPKRKYLHSITPQGLRCADPLVKLAPIRSMAKKFGDIQLARCFADFLNRLPGEEQFCVAVE